MNSRDKGKRGEREWAAFLREHFGLDAKRGVQYAGSPNSPDVQGGWEGTHPEVKRVENLDLPKAVEQAVRDSGVDKIPYVAHRKNNMPWLVTVRAVDLLRFINRVSNSLHQ